MFKKLENIWNALKHHQPLFTEFTNLAMHKKIKFQQMHKTGWTDIKRC
jgi:hypothetical protein